MLTVLHSPEPLGMPLLFWLALAILLTGIVALSVLERYEERHRQRNRQNAERLRASALRAREEERGCRATDHRR